MQCAQLLLLLLAGAGAAEQFTPPPPAPPTLLDEDVLPLVVASPLHGRVALRCPAAGSPRPAIRWTRDGIPITDADREYKVSKLAGQASPHVPGGRVFTGNRF